MLKLVKIKMMKVILLCCFVITASFFSCKSKNENEDKMVSSEQYEEIELSPEDEIMVEEANHLEYDPTQTLYFSHAFIYKYTLEDGGTEEFWIYHNPENGQLLYVPEDPMVEFVVSDTLGNYYFFGDDGHGTKTIDSQFVDWVANPDMYEADISYPVSDAYVSIKQTGKMKSLDQSSNIDGKPIVGVEYLWDFSKVSGNQTTYITEMIPVNYYQVYGFNKLEGDINLPVLALDFIGIFGKHQVVTQLISGDFNLELTNYEFNPSFVEAGDYQYSVQQADGTWKKEVFPLLVRK